MKILALEFSSEERSVAVLDSDSGANPKPFVAASRSSPRTLNAFQLIHTVLNQAGLRREEIECVAIGLGPGSYTGIRAAISIAQGWELARGVALLGISSIEALALQAQNQKIFGRISFIIDAQRNEFYLGAYEIDPAHLRPLEPVRLVSHTQLLSHAERGEILAGPEAERGSPRVQVLFPDAGALAKLAADRTDYISGERFEPIYLRETNFVKAPPPRTMPRS